jgi:hypothetical protein
MPDHAGDFPDDVPIADAVEQRQATEEPVSDDDAPWPAEADVPLEATESDWQEQRHPVIGDPEIDDPDQ